MLKVSYFHSMAWIYLYLLYRPLCSQEAQSFCLNKIFSPFSGGRAKGSPYSPERSRSRPARGHLLQRSRPQGKTQELRSLQAPQGMSVYHQLYELLHLIRTVSYISMDTRIYFNLLYSPLPSQKVPVLLNQKFSLSGVNHRSSTSSGAQNRAGSSGNFGFSPAFHPPSPPKVRGLFPLKYLTMTSITCLYLLTLFLLLRLRSLPERRTRKTRNLQYMLQQPYKGASFQQNKGAHPSNGGPQTQYRTGQQSHQPFQIKETQE